VYRSLLFARFGVRRSSSPFISIALGHASTIKVTFLPSPWWPYRCGLRFERRRKFSQAQREAGGKERF
jgi:hypothetical protein